MVVKGVMVVVVIVGSGGSDGSNGARDGTRACSELGHKCCMV